MRTIILLTISALFLLGCAAQTQQTPSPMTESSIPTLIIISTTSPTPHSSPLSEETKIPLFATSTKINTSFPNTVFHFGATPELSQIGGISGVFYREDESNGTCARTYSVFRFYDDGFVIRVSVCDNSLSDDFGKNVWTDMSEWFSRENSDKATPQGIYYVAENDIWFTVNAEYPSHTVIIDYSGTFSEDQLVLNSFSHPLGYPVRDGEAREEYVRLHVSNDP